MSITAPNASQMLERPRINLHAAGIPASDSDFENFVESGSLAYYESFDHAVSLLSGESLPDYLAAWMPTGPQKTVERAAPAPAAQASGPQTSTIGTTIAEVAPLLRSRQLSPVELTEDALQRIEQRDSTLNAFQLRLDEQARAAARRAEQEIAARCMASPLPSKTCWRCAELSSPPDRKFMRIASPITTLPRWRG